MSSKRNTPYSFIPDATYELIVYICSGILFSVLVIFFFTNPKYVYRAFVSLGVFEKILFLFIFVTFSYSYGQITSVFATYVVKKPVRLLLKKIRSKRLTDFDFDYPLLLQDFNVLEHYPKKVNGNYWTILYYLRVQFPDIADDLWERYARLKLARLNCFNALVLLFALLLAAITRAIHPLNLPILELNFVLIKLFIACIFFIVSIIEYIQRQCWFGDIVVKACASIAKINGVRHK